VPAAGHLLVTAALLLGEEAIFRGALQRALERDLERLTPTPARARLGAAALTGTVAIAALALTSAPLTPLTIAIQIAATAARGVTGRVGAAFVARSCAMAVCAFL
jgi:membrane protease YdiL (CAAX protease family)